MITVGLLRQIILENKTSISGREKTEAGESGSGGGGGRATQGRVDREGRSLLSLFH